MQHASPPAPVVTHPAVLDRLLAKAEDALYTHAEAARAAAQEVVSLASTDRLVRHRVRAETILVILDAQAGQAVDAIHRGLRLSSVATASGLSAEAARIHNVIGAAYDTLELPERAIQSYETGLAFASRAGDAVTQWRLQTNLGVAWSRLGDELRALQHLDQACELAQSAGLESRLGRVHLNRALCHRNLGDLEAAEEALAAARACVAASGHRRTEPFLGVQEGLLLAAQGQSSEALACLERAASVAEAEGLPFAESSARVERAALLRTLPAPNGDLDRALAEARRALEAAEALQGEEAAVRAHVELSMVHEAAGDLAAALHHQRRLQALRESAWRRRTAAEVGTLRVVHEVEALRREQEVLKSANERLRLLNREKAEFMAIATHDLRSPLSLVAMLAEQLQDADRVIDVGRAGQILEASADRMMGIIDRLLATDALERGARKTHIQSVDVRASVLAAADAARLSASKKGIRLEVEASSGLLARADPGALDQVLVNLVDNAVKFTPPGGSVLVRAVRVADTVRIDVLDTGPGLTDDDLTRVFGKFARLSATPTGDESSHGLGLYVVRQLTERMGGRVEAARRSSGGARFGVTLPVP